MREDLNRDTNTMNILFLDDERYPDDVFWINFSYKVHDVTIVQDAYSFKQEVLISKFDCISFDNDIQDSVEGKHLLDWLIFLYVDNKIDWFPSKIILHTMNNIAKDQMNTYIKSFSDTYNLDIEIIV